MPLKMTDDRREDTPRPAVSGQRIADSAPYALYAG